MAEYIYDRTQDDVNNRTAKGYINYTDLNRIENAIKELEQELRYHSYPLGETLVNKTDWHKEDGLSASDIENIPTLAHLQRLVHNVDTLYNSYYKYPTTPQVPLTLENATYNTANDIEHILHDLHMMVEDMIAHMKRRRCNTFNCGTM